MKILVIRMLVLVVVCTLGQSAQADLIAHWAGDGNLLDSTGNGHTGAATGGVGFASGVSGQAFSFTGSNSFVEIPGMPALEPSTISVALWVNTSAATGLRLLADSSHGTTTLEGGWALQILPDERVNFAYGNGTTFPSVSSSAIVADNTFHHVAATLSGTTMRIYVDGTLSGENLAFAGTPTESIQNNGNIRLGRHFNLNRQYNGLMDDVRVYNHALTSGEVASLAAVPEPTSGLLLGSAMVCSLFVRRRRLV